jgi:hypothetical protein
VVFGDCGGLKTMTLPIALPPADIEVFELTTLAVMTLIAKGSYKSNYHTITTIPINYKSYMKIIIYQTS